MPVTPSLPSTALTPEQALSEKNKKTVTIMAAVERNLGSCVDMSRNTGFDEIYKAGTPRAQEIFEFYGPFGPTLVLSDIQQRILLAIQKCEPESVQVSDVLMELMKPYAKPIVNQDGTVTQTPGTSPAGSKLPANVNLKVWNEATEINLNQVVQNIVLAMQPLLDATHCTVEEIV